MNRRQLLQQLLAAAAVASTKSYFDMGRGIWRLNPEYGLTTHEFMNGWIWHDPMPGDPMKRQGFFFMSSEVGIVPSTEIYAELIERPKIII